VTLEKIFQSLDLHFKRAESAFEVILEHSNHLSVFIEDSQKTQVMDSFIYRFSKIQDSMGDKLFPLILRELMEYRNSMPLKDVLNRLEKLELIPSADRWKEYRELRNILTHEYPDNEDEILEGIALATEAFQEIQEIYQRLKTGFLSA
jgi:DnaJ-domain-containing protein 1